MRHALAVLIALFALSLAACGDDDKGGGDPPPEEPPAAETALPPAEEEPAAEEPPEPECERGRRVLVEALESSLTIQGDGGLRRVSVAEVEDPPGAPLAGFNDGVYAVAAEFTGPGLDGTTGIWAASRDMVRTGGGLIIGADSVTREFSDFGAAASADSPAAEYAGEIADSDAGERARECAEG